VPISPWNLVLLENDGDDNDSSSLDLDLDLDVNIDLGPVRQVAHISPLALVAVAVAVAAWLLYVACQTVLVVPHRMVRRCKQDGEGDLFGANTFCT
jgi:hypothetical protein